MDQDVTLIGTEAGLGAGDIALHGDQVPPPQKKGHSSPHFSAHALCQTARRIKMPLGTEVGLGLGHIVLVRNPAAP